MPFFLNKDIREEGEDLSSYLSSKYGPEVVRKFNAPNNPLQLAGDKVGITFNKDRRIIPTMLCHRAIEWSNEFLGKSKTDKFMEKLFEAYFTHGQDVSKLNQLVSCALAADIALEDVNTLQAALADGKYTTSVNTKASFASQTMRVSGVPYFVIEGPKGSKPFSFSGAQPPEAIAEILEGITSKFG